MLLKKIKREIKNKRTSPDFLWKNIFFVRDFIGRSKSKFLDMLFMLEKSDRLNIKEIGSNSSYGMAKKYYYFGEFGYFHFNILGGLSQYFKIYPKYKIEIVTYEDYGKILELLFPENVKAYSVNYKFDEIYRSCHHYHNRRFRVALRKMGFKKNIAYCLVSATKELLKIQKDSSGIVFIHMIHPLVYPLEKTREKFISVFPRFRRSGANKNLNRAEWNKIIKLLLKFDYKVVVHNYSSEFIKLNARNLIYPKNVYEQIAYLNNSSLCVTPDSGFVNFAQNCKCNIFVVTNNVEYLKRYKHFNPFCTKIYVAKEDDYLPKLKRVLKRLEGGDVNGKYRKKN